MNLLRISVANRGLARAVAPSVPLETKFLAEGDSITVATSPDSYSRLWHGDHPEITYSNTAVGGSGLGHAGDVLPANTLYARQAGDLAYAPSHMSILIGANDLNGETDDYCSRLYAYIASFRAIGTIVAVCTVLPHGAGVGEDWRTAYNTRLRADVGTHFDYLVDFDTSPMGDPAAYTNTAWYPDGLHPSSTGHALLKRVYAPVINHMLGIANEPLDLSFTAVTGATASADVDSSVYTVSGLYPGESRPYSITGGTVKKNSGSFGTSGTVVNGDTLTVRVSASGTAAAEVVATLTVGATQAVFSVTTAGAGTRDWVPTDLGSKLAVWLQPSGYVHSGSNNSAGREQVAVWNDSSPNAVTIGVNAVNSFPVIAATLLNGIEFLDFPNIALNAQCRYTMPIATRGSGGGATFVVAKQSADPDSTAAHAKPPVADFGTGLEEFHPYLDGTFLPGYGANARKSFTAAGHPTLTAWRIQSWHSKNSDWRWYEDATLIHQDLANTAAWTSTGNIGDHFDGSIAEVIDCSNFLTDAEREKVEGYLAWKYGLEANLPSGHTYELAAPTI